MLVPPPPSPLPIGYFISTSIKPEFTLHPILSVTTSAFKLVNLCRRASLPTSQPKTKISAISAARWEALSLKLVKIPRTDIVRRIADVREADRKTPNPEATRPASRMRLRKMLPDVFLVQAPMRNGIERAIAPPYAAACTKVAGMRYDLPDTSLLL